MALAQISVITACYNDGAYLDDAYESLQLEKYKDVFEYIIVDDGSTDQFTLHKFEELKAKGVTVIHQPNRGLGAARNTGISAAKGEYIIPLDSDNKLVPDVIIKAAAILDNNQDISVVYTDNIFFGTINERRVIGPFDQLRILNRNYIDACALIRKSALENAGGYDGKMPQMGHEDWELWINISLNGGKLHYLNEVGFLYRVSEQSMSSYLTPTKIAENRKYIFIKHAPCISAKYAELYEIEQKYKRKLDNINSYFSKHRIKALIKLLIGKLHA